MKEEQLETLQTVPIKDESGVSNLRQELMNLVDELGFSTTDRTKLLTAASELARNILVYGNQGEAVVELVENEDSRGLKIVFDDEGPGIEDVDRALQEGWKHPESEGLGKGLSGARKLADDFDIETTPGEGTRITIRKMV